MMDKKVLSTQGLAPTGWCSNVSYYKEGIQEGGGTRKETPGIKPPLGARIFTSFCSVLANNHFAPEAMGAPRGGHLQ